MSAKLPRSEKTERAIIGIIIQYPNRLADCEKLGISEIHFHGAEKTISREIIRSDSDGRPFDYNSLSDHFANTFNGNGHVFVARLGEYMSEDDGRPAARVPALLPEYCRT